MKSLTALFSAAVVVIVVSFGMSVYTAVRQKQAEKPAEPRVIATPATTQ